MRKLLALLLVVVLAVPVQNVGAESFDTTAPFTDANYHEYLLYNPDTTNIDVLIMPPATTINTFRDLALIEQGIEMWNDGIKTMAPAWLADNFDMNWYRVGIDPVPQDAATDPEIMVISASYNPVRVGVLGVGLEPWQQVLFNSPCHGVDFPLTSQAEAEELLDFHQHEDSPWATARAQCGNGGYTCLVINMEAIGNTAQNARNMYDLNTHEFGHCLGIGHVGDATDFSATTYPPKDIMSYQNGAQVNCVSTLNILAMERTYGEILGRGGGNSAGGYVHMKPEDYQQQVCTNPVANWLDTSVLDEADPLGDPGDGTPPPPPREPFATIESPDDGAQVPAGTVQIIGNVGYQDGGGELAVSAGGPYVGEAGEAIAVSATITGGGGNAQCQWIGGAFADATACSTTVQFPDADGSPYTIAVQATEEGFATVDDATTVSIRGFPDTDSRIKTSYTPFNEGSPLAYSSAGALVTGFAGDPVPKFIAGQGISFNARFTHSTGPTLTSGSGEYLVFDAAGNRVAGPLAAPRVVDQPATGGCNTAPCYNYVASWTPDQPGTYFFVLRLNEGGSTYYVQHSAVSNQPGYKEIQVIGADAPVRAAADAEGDSLTPAGDITSIAVTEREGGIDITLGLANIETVDAQWFKFEMATVDWLACTLWLPWETRGDVAAQGDGTSFTVDFASRTATLSIDTVDLHGTAYPYAVSATSHVGDCFTETGTNEDRAPDTGTVDVTTTTPPTPDGTYFFNGAQVNPFDAQSSATYMATTLDGAQTFVNTPGGGAFPGTVFASSWEHPGELGLDGNDITLTWYADVVGTAATPFVQTAWDIQLWVDNGDGVWSNTNTVPLATNPDVYFFTGSTPYRVSHDVTQGTGVFSYTIPDVMPTNPDGRIGVVIDGNFIDSTTSTLLHYGHAATPARMEVEVLEILDSDGDGVPDEDDLCPNTPPGTTVDDEGCPVIIRSGERVEIAVDGSVVNHANVAGENGASFAIPVELALGPHSLTATWYDAADNALASHTIAVEATSGFEPSITIASPADAEEVERDFTASGTAQAAEGEAGLEADFATASRIMDSAQYGELLGALERLPGFLGASPLLDGSARVAAYFDGPAPAALPATPLQLVVVDDVELQRARLDLPASAVPTGQANFEPGPLNGLGPGSTLLSYFSGNVGLCTANFIWEDTDTGDLYLGAAGHCFMDEDKTSTHGTDKDWSTTQTTRIRACLSTCLGGVTGLYGHGVVRVDPFAAMVDLGPLVYARQTKGGVDVGNDFGIVKIPDNLRSLVRTEVQAWGGPTHVDSMENGDFAALYGNAIVLGETFATKARAGVGYNSDAKAWRAVLPSAQGDSGSAVVGLRSTVGGTTSVEGTGAFGLLTHLSVSGFRFPLVPAGITAGTTVPQAIVMAQEAGVNLRMVRAGEDVTDVGPKPPTAPSDLAVTAGDGFADLTWSIPSDGGSAITGYTVSYGTSPGTYTATLADDATPGATVTGLTNGQTYYFAVQATNSVGTSGYSNEVAGTPTADPTAPAAPTNVAAAGGDGTILISWDAPDNGGSAITHYTVSYGTEAGSYSSSVDTTDTEATLTGLTNGQTYYLAVTATNSVGESDASAEVSATPMAPPPVHQVFVRASNPGGVVLDWTAAEFDGSNWHYDFAAMPTGELTVDARLTEFGAPIASDSVTVTVTFPDQDGDGVRDDVDNCPSTPNADQADMDGDGKGDVCDGQDNRDSDEDGVENWQDICHGHDDHQDVDGDGIPDGCDDDNTDGPLGDADGDGVLNQDDVCNGHDDNADVDGDGIADGCDPDNTDGPLGDSDGDGVVNQDDICDGDDTVDVDNDGIPDDCDPLVDSDGDGVADDVDACPGFDDGADADGDGIADGCDPDNSDGPLGDADGDGVVNQDDAFPADPTEWADSDSDGVGDNADECAGHDDGADLDGDGIPDGCDDDRDGDGWSNDDELAAGTDPDDPESHPKGAIKDSDGDGFNDKTDNCKHEANADQADADGDGKGDACDKKFNPKNGGQEAAAGSSPTTAPIAEAQSHDTTSVSKGAPGVSLVALLGVVAVALLRRK